LLKHSPRRRLFSVFTPATGPESWRVGLRLLIISRELARRATAMHFQELASHARQAGLFYSEVQHDFSPRQICLRIGRKYTIMHERQTNWLPAIDKKHEKLAQDLIIQWHDYCFYNVRIHFNEVCLFVVYADFE
jgi:hypothetical protein